MSEFEVCKGYNYPCDCCTKPNCPERKKPYQPSKTELAEMYGITEEEARNQLR